MCSPNIDRQYQKHGEATQCINTGYLSGIRVLCSGMGSVIGDSYCGSLCANQERMIGDSNCQFPVLDAQEVWLYQRVSRDVL